MSRITTRDIARRAEVSQSTVSFVLSGKHGVSITDDTRKRVLDAARDLGYKRPDRYRRDARRNITVALLVPTMSNLYYPFLLQSVQLYANNRGVGTIIINTLRDMEPYRGTIDTLSKLMVDGILCLYTPKFPLPKRIPAVVVSEKNPATPYDTVGLNSHTAGYMMADHLISLGHERIAYISSPLGNITQSRAIRLEGIRARLTERGLERNLTVLASTDETERMDTVFEYNTGRLMVERLLREGPEVSAIIAVNDMTAAGCVSVLQEKGVKIPSEMAVCGFDNLLISQIMRPQLTSIDQTAYHGGKTGLDMLLEKIMGEREDDGVSIRVEYEPHLFVRGSTVEGAGGGV